MYFYYKNVHDLHTFITLSSPPRSYVYYHSLRSTDYLPPAYSMMIKPRLFTLNAVFLKHNEFKKEYI